jgi:hypothetical protein
VPPLPPPLPPAERTVGQLVAEAIRLYGRRFWPSLALGFGPAILNVLVRTLDYWIGVVLVAAVGGAVLAASYVGAVAIAAERPIQAVRAWVAGTLVFVPFPFLVTIFIFPGLIWLAAFGLVVPVVALERRGLRDGFRRALQLARADFVHALGSLAALAIVVALTQGVLIFVLRGFGDQALAAASFIASAVVSPLLFLGSALLYYDQAGRQDAGDVPLR